MRKIPTPITEHLKGKTTADFGFMKQAPKLTLGFSPIETSTECKRLELRNMLISNILNTLSKDPALPDAVFKQMADGAYVAALISQFVEPLLDRLYPLGKP